MLVLPRPTPLSVTLVGSGDKIQITYRKATGTYIFWTNNYCPTIFSLILITIR